LEYLRNLNNILPIFKFSFVVEKTHGAHVVLEPRDYIFRDSIERPCMIAVESATSVNGNNYLSGFGYF